MPLYMDRHDVSSTVTAENVAELHHQDLKIQHLYNCRGLTYWFDKKRSTAFCLVDAPDIQSIQEMHAKAHGEVPNQIIEVEASIVESFLGRIEDPEKSQNTELNIINDPAFRTIMVAAIEHFSLKDLVAKKTDTANNNYSKLLIEITNKYQGRLVKQKDSYFLLSFDSVTNAVLCALEIQRFFNENNKSNSPLNVKIGLSAGAPVNEKEGFFEDIIQMAERLSAIVKGQVAISSEVKDLYESENMNISLCKSQITSLSLNDEKFLNLLMDYIEKEWSNPALDAGHFSKCLGYSKSQLYRKMISITGKAPNNFIKQYRLNKALILLNKKNENISGIAYKTGFNSPAYFSKCFQETYGVLPSFYIKSYCL